MNALVRIRNSQARRLEPVWKLSHAHIARSSVSCTRSLAVSGSRQIRIATPNSSAWCGRQAASNAPCARSISRSPSDEPTTRSDRRGAAVGLRTRRELEGTDLVELIEVRDMPEPQKQPTCHM